ncbi:MAG: hypothetical protein ACHQ49_08910 [Elusimicrobiota bacterium]
MIGLQCSASDASKDPFNENMAPRFINWGITRNEQDSNDAVRRTRHRGGHRRLLQELHVLKRGRRAHRADPDREGGRAMNHLRKTALVVMIPAVLAFVLPPVARAQNTGLNPSSVQLKVLQVMISTNADCTNAVSVGAANPQAIYQEMTTNPTLLSGAIAPGTYKCVWINISSLLKFTPAVSSTDGICAAGTQVTRDICRTPETFPLPTGGTGSCVGTSSTDGVDTPYWVTFSVAGGGGSKLLASPLVVTGSQSITFVMDFDGRIQSETGTNICNCEAPTMSFR